MNTGNRFQEIQWTLFAVDNGLTEAEITEITSIDVLKPLHEAFIKEMFFRFPHLHGKLQVGISMPEVVPPAAL